MTTAHRPTFFNALGHDLQGGNMMVPTQVRRDRDENQELKMKIRGTKNQHLKQFKSRADYMAEVEKKEAEETKEKKAKKGQDPQAAASSGYDSAKAFAKLPDVPEENPFPEDDDAVFDNDEAANKNDAGSDSESSDDDDSEDHEALMRELEKIKKEKEAEREKEEAEDKKVRDAEKKEQIGGANPLLNQEQSLKRRWDEDTVFKDQLRTKPKEPRRFINDSVRSGFHRKFLQKYLKVD